IGDLFAPALKLKQRIPTSGLRPHTSGLRAEREEPAVIVNGIRLPKMKSQSGRRLFLFVSGDAGNELWLDMHGKLKRWILRPDREGGRRLIAMPAGDFKPDPLYYRGEVPPAWRRRIRIQDAG